MHHSTEHKKLGIKSQASHHKVLRYAWQENQAPRRPLDLSEPIPCLPAGPARRSFNTSQRASHGLVIATFFDLRAAIAAHDALSSPALAPPPHGSPVGAPLAPPRSVRFVALGGSRPGGSAGTGSSSPAEGAARAPAGILAVEIVGKPGLSPLLLVACSPFTMCTRQHAVLPLLLLRGIAAGCVTGNCR
jgi:hypothetical protein